MFSVRSDLTRASTLPGPILNRFYRRLAVRRVIRRLLDLAHGRDRYDPQTWQAVADILGVAIADYKNFRAGTGKLVYQSYFQTWVIELNTAFSPYRQACILVHELAHYFFRTMDPCELTGEPIIYHYAGPVGCARHDLSREVENQIMRRRRAR